MNTYLEKVSFSVTASSSKSWATATSTKAFSGYLHSVYYTTDATNPLTAGSSSYFQLRADSTSGRVVCRTSSGIAGAKRYWYPRHAIHTSTAWKLVYATSSANAWFSDRPVVCNEKLVLCKIAGSSTGGGGSTEGMSAICFLEGVHP